MECNWNSWIFLAVQFSGQGWKYFMQIIFITFLTTAHNAFVTASIVVGYYVTFSLII